jgi:hypothetical protein
MTFGLAYRSTYSPTPRHIVTFLYGRISSEADILQAWCAESFEPVPRNWAVKMETWPRNKMLPGDLVDDQKLFFWIKDFVIPRPPSKGKRVRAQQERREQRRKVKAHKDALAELCNEIIVAIAEDEETEEALQLHHNSVKSYITAIVKLWAFQSGTKVNPRPNPRSEQLGMLVDNLRTGTYEQDRKEFADRLEGTLYDTYTQEDIPRHTQAAWNWPDRTCLGQALRTNVDFLLGTHTAKRPSEISNLELPDLFSFALPQAYKSRQRKRAAARALVAVMRQGKENQEGRIEKAGVLRHRDPLACAVGQTAFWLFWRFEHEKEPLPDFSDRQLWYHTKVLRRDKKNPIG